MSEPTFGHFGPFEKEASICYSALVVAAQKSIEFRNHLDTSTCFRKADRSPVTVFDHTIQAIILKRIVEAFPDEIIIAEESLKGDLAPEFTDKLKEFVPDDINITSLFSHVRETAPSTCTRYWTIDPIDGTSGYKREGGQYAVAIAIIENHDCVFSAIAWPNALPIYTGRDSVETLFCFAARGHGSFITNGKADFERVNVGSVTKDTVILPPGIKSNMEERLRAVVGNLGLEYQPLCFTSMTKAISLCLGVGCMYIRIPYGGDEYVYDIAPVSTFVEEAGAIVTTGDGKKLTFSNEGLAVGTNCGTLFSNRGPEFHKRLVRAYLQAIGGE